MSRKLVKTIKQSFKKGVIYNLADGEDIIPKLEYRKYFANSDEDILTEHGEWCAEDLCIKSVTIELKIYE
jgi:hypothetical protein